MATMFAARGTTNQLFRIQKNGPQLKNSSSILQIRDATDTNYNALESASLAVNLGSASSPSFTFNGDTNTGMYSAGADQVNFTTNGTLRFTIRDPGAADAVATFSGTSAITLPVGNNSTQRPTSPVAGMLRYENTSNNLEFYNGTSWVTVGSTPTLQQSYNASSNPELVLDSTRGALTVRDNATPIGANLFEVQNNAGTTTFFNVTVQGAGLQLGSASSPSLFFQGDTNTGMYSPAADTLALVGGGNEIFRIDSTGNIRFTNGSFASLGDAAVVQYILRGTTTDATPTEILVNGTNRMTLANNSTWKFDISLVARRTDVDDENAAYTFRGCIYRNANASSTAIAGVVNKSVDAEQDLDWDATVDADTTNGSLRIRVTGEAAKTIRWVAFVTTTQVVEI